MLRNGGLNTTTSTTIRSGSRTPLRNGCVTPNHNVPNGKPHGAGRQRHVSNENYYDINDDGENEEFGLRRPFLPVSVSAVEYPIRAATNIGGERLFPYAIPYHTRRPSVPRTMSMNRVKPSQEELEEHYWGILAD